MLFSFFIVNRYLHDPVSVSESTVATAVNLIATPFCIALMPFWMWVGTLIFRPEAHCKASVIIKMLYVPHSLSCLLFQ
jgi:hypothetical protein